MPKNYSFVPRVASVGGGVFETPTTTLPTGWFWDTNTNTFTSARPWAFKTPPARTGTLRSVTNQATFDSAYAAAVSGDYIEVDAGVTLDPITINKSGIVIIVKNFATNFTLNRCVDISDSVNMFTIRSVNTNEYAVRAGTGSITDFWIIGAKITNTSGVNNTSALIDFSPETCGFTAKAQMPNRVAINYSIIVGQDVAGVPGQRRGWTPGGYNNAAYCTRGYNISDKDGSDSQMFCTWDHIDGFIAERCYLEAAAETIMFGGASMTQMDGTYSGPQNICIYQCRFHKPLAWFGAGFNLKNTIEIKNGKNIAIVNNVIENNSEEDQGYIFNFIPVNQNEVDAQTNFTFCEEITIIGNRFEGTLQGTWIAVSERYSPKVVAAKKFHISHNFLPSQVSTGGFGDGMAHLGHVRNLVYENNTAATLRTIYHKSDEGAALAQTYPVGTGPRIRSNINYNDSFYAVRINGTSNPPLNVEFDTVFDVANNWCDSHNVSVGDDRHCTSGGTPDCTGTNQFAADAAAIGFTDIASGNFKLSGVSPYLGDGHDGRDPGADYDTMVANLAGVPS